jgi:hypothetical protein
MGRASKLFPLGGRKDSVGTQSSASSSREILRPLSKAERLLGASGLQDAARHQLPRRPSYISLNPSISELGDEVDYDDFSTPDHFGLEPLPLRLADLQHGAPQDGLGRSASSRSSASNHSRRIKGSWSSAALNSHYDAASAPLNTSPQIRNSAVRDRPLRHGMPPVSETSVANYRRPSTASATSTAYDSQDSMDSTTALPDITRLYPKSPFVNQVRLSLSRGADSSPATAHTATPSLRFPGAAPTSRLSTGAASTRRSVGAAGRTLKGRISADVLPHSIKIFSRRHQGQPTEPMPKSNSRREANARPKNWWDNLSFEEEGSDTESEHDLNLVTPTRTLFLPTARTGSSPRPSDPQLIPHDHRDTVFTIRKMGSSHEIMSARSSTTLRSPRTPLSRGSRPSSRIAVNDLRETSVLSISSSSSSETESEPEAESSDELPPPRDFRDSIAVSEIDVHHVGQAQALHVKTMRRTPEDTSTDRRPSIASVSSNPTTADSSSVRSLNNGPSYLSVPHLSNRSRKSGRIRQPRSIPEDSDTSSQFTYPTSPPASMRSFSTPQGEHRKLMAVTEEEEALLELMRRRRADKAAQRDSSLASIKSSSTTYSNRPFSNLSASSSILDSFPLSRSQRSSLLASRATTHQTPPETSSASKDSSEWARKRQSVATIATDNTSYSIDSHLESPTRLKYAFTPHLSLASLDVNLTGVQPTTLDEPSAPTSEPPDSPTTPLTRCGSVDVLIREASSKRNSAASYAYGERSQVDEELLQEKLRRKTTSNATFHSSLELDKFKRSEKNAEAPEPTPPSSDEEQISPQIGSRESLSSGSSKGVSSSSKNTNECGPTCAHFSHRDSAGYNRRSVGYGAGIGTRCSVSEDVLAAWGSLGGWRDPPGITS